MLLPLMLDTSRLGLEPPITDCCKVKTNLGHSEATSGLSSIIKATLALEKGCIPATIGVQTINPKIKVDEWNVKIVTDVTPWPAQTNEYGSVRRIGINSFGYGGANSQ